MQQLLNFIIDVLSVVIQLKIQVLAPYYTDIKNYDNIQYSIKPEIKILSKPEIKNMNYSFKNGIIYFYFNTIAICYYFL